jgi:hypothetical protein
MKTTLRQIHGAYPCIQGYRQLLRHLGPNFGKDTPISLATVIDSNGIVDALWCLRAVMGYRREKRLFAVWCARQVQHLFKDERSLNSLGVAERYTQSTATKDELDDAYRVAHTASAATFDKSYCIRCAAMVATAATREDADLAADEAAHCAAVAIASEETMPGAGDTAQGDAEDRARKAQADELRRVCVAIDAGIDPYPASITGEPA